MSDLRAGWPALKQHKITLRAIEITGCSTWTDAKTKLEMSETGMNLTLSFPLTEKLRRGIDEGEFASAHLAAQASRMKKHNEECDRITEAAERKYEATRAAWLDQCAVCDADGLPRPPEPMRGKTHYPDEPKIPTVNIACRSLADGWLDGVFEKVDPTTKEISRAGTLSGAVDKAPKIRIADAEVTLEVIVRMNRVKGEDRDKLIALVSGYAVVFSTSHQELPLEEEETEIEVAEDVEISVLLPDGSKMPINQAAQDAVDRLREARAKIGDTGPLRFEGAEAVQ